MTRKTEPAPTRGRLGSAVAGVGQIATGIGLVAGLVVAGERHPCRRVARVSAVGRGDEDSGRDERAAAVRPRSVRVHLVGDKCAHPRVGVSVRRAVCDGPGRRSATGQQRGDGRGERGHVFACMHVGSRKCGGEAIPPAIPKGGSRTSTVPACASSAGRRRDQGWPGVPPGLTTWLDTSVNCRASPLTTTVARAVARDVASAVEVGCSVLALSGWVGREPGGIRGDRCVE
jgi:hypothetical protein